MTTENLDGYEKFIAGIIIKMKTVDSMTLCREVNYQTGRSIDWHVFSEYLERMASLGILEYAGFTTDGHQIYEYVA